MGKFANSSFAVFVFPAELSIWLNVASLLLLSYMVVNTTIVTPTSRKMRTCRALGTVWAAVLALLLPRLALLLPAPGWLGLLVLWIGVRTGLLHSYSMVEEATYPSGEPRTVVSMTTHG